MRKTWVDPMAEYGLRDVALGSFVGSGSVIIIPEKVRLHGRARIDSGVYLSVGLEMYENTAICRGASLIGGPEAKVTMHPWTFVGYHSLVMAGTERYDGVNGPVNQFWYAGLEGEETPVIKGDVVLMPHSGVASMSTVFPGVTLPEGCLIGAHSMVRHDRDLKPWYIHVGVPARPWRPRDQRAKELGADERRWKRHG